ncbi:MAG: hypothetical protein KCHDKBKB_00543 [Elusimicrobia bacterium]|nr:hypothetical protein [Elusimicrobiota bacterium]
MNAYEANWILAMQRRDTSIPENPSEGELIYTLFLSDFIRIPHVDYRNLSVVDAQIQTLFN